MHLSELESSLRFLNMQQLSKVKQYTLLKDKHSICPMEPFSMKSAIVFPVTNLTKFCSALLRATISIYIFVMPSKTPISKQIHSLF